MIRIIREETFDKDTPWAYFNEASQQYGSLSGGGDFINKSENYCFKISIGFGSRSNNYVELLALKTLMLITLENGCQSLQIFDNFQSFVLSTPQAHDAMWHISSDCLFAHPNSMRKRES